MVGAVAPSRHGAAHPVGLAGHFWVTAPCAGSVEGVTVNDVIGFLKGTALDEQVVLTSDGVGWLVHCPRPLLAGEAVELRVITRVREDSITLYGFDSGVDQACFTALLKVRGVGPASALAIVGALGASGLAGALKASDKAALAKAPGVGATTAARILSELELPDGIVADEPVDETVAEVRSALVGLGFAEGSVDIAVGRAAESLGGGAGADELLAAALAVLRGDD